MQVEILPVYYPSDDEVADPSLFALNVRKVLLCWIPPCLAHATTNPCTSLEPICFLSACANPVPFCLSQPMLRPVAKLQAQWFELIISWSMQLMAEALGAQLTEHGYDQNIALKKNMVHVNLQGTKVVLSAN